MTRRRKPPTPLWLLRVRAREVRLPPDNWFNQIQAELVASVTARGSELDRPSRQALIEALRRLLIEPDQKLPPEESNDSPHD